MQTFRAHNKPAFLFLGPIKGDTLIDYFIDHITTASWKCVQLAVIDFRYSMSPASPAAHDWLESVIKKLPCHAPTTKTDQE